MRFEKLTGYPAADGLWRRLPGFLRVSQCRPRTRTCTLCAHMQSLRLSPTEGSSAQDIALGRNRSWKCCGCFAVYLELTGWKEEEEENRRQLPRRNDKKHLFYPPKPEGIVFISETYCKRWRISHRPRSARYKYLLRITGKHWSWTFWNDLKELYVIFGLLDFRANKFCYVQYKLSQCPPWVFLFCSLFAGWQAVV